MTRPTRKINHAKTFHPNNSRNAKPARILLALRNLAGPSDDAGRTEGHLHEHGHGQCGLGGALADESGE